MALVKFPLIMADGFKANTLEELKDKEHFDIKSVLGYFRDRRLIRWLKARNYVEEVAAVEKLSKDENNLSKKLGAIFGFEIEDGPVEPPPDLTEIMRRLRQLTDDKKLLEQVEQELSDGTVLVVFDQAKFDKKAQYFDRIYLASSQFDIPLTETNKTYIGIGENVRAVIKSDKIVDFDALNITFERMRFDDDYQKIVEHPTEEKKSNRAEELYNEGEQAADNGDWTTALEKYKQAAELGYPKAFGEVGFIYEIGFGTIEKDIADARRWYKRGMEKNDAASFGWYAFSLNHYDASEDEKREAFKCMKRATELAPEDGGWWANLGDMYRDGDGTEKNLAKTVECYEKGVQFGNSYAANELGGMYDNGKYVEQDPRKAFELFKQAVEFDDKNTYAMRNLAYCYRHGDGTEKNLAKAFDLFKQVAEAGDVKAMEITADMLFKGEGVQEDEYESFRWLKKSVDGGNKDVSAIRKLATCYRYGLGTPKDLTKAVPLFYQAADEGDVPAIMAMGEMFRDGEGSVDKNFKEALRYFQRAANAGYGEAAYKLAMMYLNGWGVQQSNRNYEYWLSKSQELGYESPTKENLQQLDQSNVFERVRKIFG